MSKYIWLSHPLSEKTPAYGGAHGLDIKQVNSIIKGDSCNTAIWYIPNHLGTHVDSPKHFFKDGEAIDKFNPEFWVFERVITISLTLSDNSILIGPQHIVPFLKGKPDLILIRTGMGQYRKENNYWEANPGLNPGLGRELRSSCPSLRAVGVDFISISSWKNREAGREAHREFLNPSPPGSPIILIEDMDLSPLTVNTRVLRLFALPIRVEDGDGAPCTVLAEVETID